VKVAAGGGTSHFRCCSRCLCCLTLGCGFAVGGLHSVSRRYRRPGGGGDRESASDCCTGCY